MVVIGTLIGIALFVYTVSAAGPDAILAGIRRIGRGFALVLILSALRMMVRAKAWTLCVEESEHLSFRHALQAYITGDALGNVTPLGPLASESTKAILSRQSLPMSDAVSSIVLENIFYSTTVAVMLTVGTLAFFVGYRPIAASSTVAAGVAATALLGAGLVWWLLRAQPRVLSRFLKYDVVRETEERVFRFVGPRKGRVAKILGLEFLFHASAVLEIYILLALLIGPAASFLLALVLEAGERAVTVAFKFVPLRLGVDQLGSGSMTVLLGIGWETGVTIATIRTARNLFWAAVGLTLLAVLGGMRNKRPAETSRPLDS
jgi:hypothetical protein